MNKVFVCDVYVTVDKILYKIFDIENERFVNLTNRFRKF